MQSSDDRGVHGGVYGYVGRDEGHEKVARSWSDFKFYGSATEIPSGGRSTQSQFIYQPSMSHAAGDSSLRHFAHSEAASVPIQHQPQTAAPLRSLASSLSASSTVTTVPSGASSSMLWGEVDREESSSSGKQATRPLWQSGWQPKVLSCSVPRLHSCPAIGPSGDHTPTLR